MKADFENKLVSIFGLHETGKTHIAKVIAQNYTTAVFDVLGEYDEQKFDIWNVQSDSYPEVQQEFDDFLEFLRNNKQKDNGNWDMLLCDETSTVHPNKKSMPSTMNNFLNYYRHSVEEKGWDMGGIFIARRPARMNTNIVELSRYIIVFRVTGKNDIKYLNGIATKNISKEKAEELGINKPVRNGKVNVGLGDMASCLGQGDRPDHEFILVEPDRNFTLMNPI